MIHFDDLGLPLVLRNALNRHTEDMRGTGRTTRQVRALKPGDVFLTTKAQARDIEREVKISFGEGVQVITIEPTSDALRRVIDQIMHHGKYTARIVVDHHIAECVAAERIGSIFGDLEHACGVLANRAEKRAKPQEFHRHVPGKKVRK